MKILIIGCWHLGSVIGACLSKIDKNKVFLWDKNQAVAKNWMEGKPPIFEPGLSEIAATHYNENLFWCGEELDKIVKEVDWIIFAYDTPTDEQDEVQLGLIWEGVDLLIKSGICINSNILFTSQLPVGTTRKIQNKLKKHISKWDGVIIYSPENLRLGNAILAFEKPDRIVLGFDQREESCGKKIEMAFRQLIQNNDVPIELMSLESAEMVKHALNSFLGTCIIFANEISNICEKIGASAWDVLSSLKSDSRIGHKAFLKPGLGFTGGTIARDFKILINLQDSRFFSNLYKKNLERNDWIINKLRDKLGSLDGRKIVLLGVTYKPGTSTIRKSPSVDVAKLLNENGAIVFAVDPYVDLSELSIDCRNRLPFILENDIFVAFKDADAAVLITEWQLFQEFDWEHIAAVMKKNLIIDTKHFLCNINTNLFELIIPGKV